MRLNATRHHAYVAAAEFGPAPASGRGRPPLVTGSFALTEIGR
jgi:hypothetical protein